MRSRQYKSESFRFKLLDCLRALQVPLWSTAGIKSGDIKVHKVSGSLTNAVFFVSCHPSLRGLRTLLLRIYGPSSGSLISRPRELHTLHVLSSQYHIGPRVYGTFENGRVEEYFESTTLTPSDIRDPTVSRWIGARMAELHSVDIDAVEGNSPPANGKAKEWDIGAKNNVKAWLAPAEDVLKLPVISDAIRAQLDLKAFKKEWSRYLQWLLTADDVNNGSRRVFAHNDAQYGNLLRLRHSNVVDEHRQVGDRDGSLSVLIIDHPRKIIVVDFEYAGPNPASYDIANHFHEWTADYHSSTPHLYDFSRYPTYEQRRNFCTAYLGHTAMFREDPADRELQLDNLEEQVRVWSPASHAVWAIWGIVQARDDLRANATESEFDYIGYSICRMAAFRREILALGI